MKKILLLICVIGVLFVSVYFIYSTNQYSSENSQHEIITKKEFQQILDSIKPYKKKEYKYDELKALFESENYNPDEREDVGTWNSTNPKNSTQEELEMRWNNAKQINLTNEELDALWEKSTPIPLEDSKEQEIKAKMAQCNNNNTNSCQDVGFYYLNDSTQDYTKAFSFLQKGCSDKNPYSCHNLGIMYSNGYGVDKNYFEAINFFKLACMNEPFLCSSIANAYYNGRGVKQDYQKSLKLWGKLCEAGWTDNCHRIGTMYEFGNGIQKNYKKAKEYYGKACDFKDQKGCDAYADLNNKGY